MWKQTNLFGLSWIAILPSLTLAVSCPEPETGNVTFNYDTVTVAWPVNIVDTQCVRGYLVCWTQTANNDYACDSVPARTGSYQITGLAPCSFFTVHVAKVNWDGRTSDIKNYTGVAGPPKVSRMTVTQQNSKVITLNWPSVQSYNCVSKIEIWFCDSSNRTHYLGCQYAEFPRSVNRLELKDFQVCRNSYIQIRTAGTTGTNLSATEEFVAYVDSANQVTNLKARNITTNSAVIAWWLSNVNKTCSNERLRLCYKASRSTYPACYSWNMTQLGSSDSASLNRLNACTTYTTTVSLRTRKMFTNRTVTFTTPLGIEAMRASVTNVTNSTALVNYAVVTNSTDCRPSSMVVCLYQNANVTTPRNCTRPILGLRSTVSLYGMAPCTSYRVLLVVQTATRPQPSGVMNFTTSSEGALLLESMSLDEVDSAIVVKWVPVPASLQCVQELAVSWSTSASADRTRTTVNKYSATYTIPRVSAGLTYYVDVEAYMEGRVAQSLSGQIATACAQGHVVVQGRYSGYPNLEM